VSRREGGSGKRVVIRGERKENDHLRAKESVRKRKKSRNASEGRVLLSIRKSVVSGKSRELSHKQKPELNKEIGVKKKRRPYPLLVD